MKKLLLVLPMTLMFVGCNTQEVINEEVLQKQEVTDFEKDAFVYSLSDLGYITKMNTKTKEVEYINKANFTSTYSDSWSAIKFISETEAYTIGEKTGVVIMFNPSTGDHNEITKPTWPTTADGIDATYKTLEILNREKAYTIFKEKKDNETFGTLVEIDLVNKSFKKVNENIKIKDVGGNLKIVDTKTAYSIDLKGKLHSIDLETGDSKFKSIEPYMAGVQVSKDEQWMGIGYLSEEKIYAISKDTGIMIVIDATMKRPLRVIANTMASTSHNGKWMSLSVISETLGYLIAHDGTLLKVNPTTGEFKKVLQIDKQTDNTSGQLIEDAWCTVSFSGFVQ